MDVDGTLTDGKIYMGPNGEVMKAFNIKDGAGIHDMLIPHGITPVIITGRMSDIVLMRCKELGVLEVYQGVTDKFKKLIEFLELKKCGLDRVAYIGDDINDLPCMDLIKQNGGIIGCPSDAISAVRNIANHISTTKGGEGAVRDFIEFIISQNEDRSFGTNLKD